MTQRRIPRLFTPLAALPLMLAVSLPAMALAQGRDGGAKAAPAPADNDSGRADTNRRGNPKGPAAFFLRWDTDGDGKVSLASLPERARERLGAADSNRDGTLTRAEHQAFHDARQAEFLAAADRDRDGKVSDEERAAYREARRADGADNRHGPKARRGPGDGSCKGDRGRSGRGPQGKPSTASAR